MSSASPVSCPRCGMINDVQKVTAILRSGTFYGYTTTQTKLAEELAPPAQPKYDPPIDGGILVIIIILALILSGVVSGLFFGGSEGEEIGVGSVIFIFATVTPLLWLSSKTPQARLTFAEASTLWETQMRRHDQLYYCFKDDLVFIPGDGRLVPPSQWRTIL